MFPHKYQAALLVPERGGVDCMGHPGKSLFQEILECVIKTFRIHIVDHGGVGLIAIRTVTEKVMPSVCTQLGNAV